MSMAEVVSLMLGGVGAITGVAGLLFAYRAAKSSDVSAKAS